MKVIIIILILLLILSFASIYHLSKIVIKLKTDNEDLIKKADDCNKRLLSILSPKL